MIAVRAMIHPVNNFDWALFSAIILSMVAADLWAFRKAAGGVTFAKAFKWTVIWVVIALAFCGHVFYNHGRDPAVLFLTAYIVEQTLSVDNLFVFLTIFAYFRLTPDLQHRVLFWGVFGAMIMRAIFIVAGTALLREFSWVMYVFGAILIFTGIKVVRGGGEGVEPEKTWILRFAQKHLRTVKEFHGDRFFVRRDGLLYATPMFIVLLTVEFTDVLFAVDSVPAVLSISPDIFIVYTSNIFAVMGLRAMFFVLSGMVDKFRYLGPGVAAILIFIGVKMLISGVFHVPPAASLAVIASILVIAIAASWIWQDVPAEMKHHEPENPDSTSPAREAANPEKSA